MCPTVRDVAQSMRSQARDPRVTLRAKMHLAAGQTIRSTRIWFSQGRVSSSLDSTGWGRIDRNQRRNTMWELASPR